MGGPITRSRSAASRERGWLGHGQPEEVAVALRHEEQRGRLAGGPPFPGDRRSACQSDGRVRALPSECATIGVQRIHHVAMVTSDYGKLLRFYRDAFDAVGPDACEQPSVVDVGTARLHVFEEAVSGDAGAQGRLHHFALEAEDLEEFVAARNRLLSLGACDERVIDFGVGAHVSLLATDPDGGMLELLVAVDSEAELPFAVERHE
jgi:catechol 2,3-dioxygenase-like lactoylglutathione lyase family enzyme